MTKLTHLDLFVCSQALAEKSRRSQPLLKELCRSLSRLLPEACGYVLQWPRGGAPEMVESFRKARSLPADRLSELLQLLGGDEMKAAQVIPVDAASSHAFAPDTQFFTGVPMEAGGERLGVIVTGFVSRAAAENASELLRPFAALAAAHLANAQSQEAAAEKLHFLETHDTLVTQLPNRRLFRQRAAAEIEGGSAAIVFFDLDGFNEINRRFGYAVGDEVLREVAVRWRGLVEQVCPEATLARMGGDEFALLLPGRKESAAIEALAEQFLAVLREPLAIGAEQYSLHGSAGFCIHRAGGGDLEHLLRLAAEAMFAAKAAGGDRAAGAGQSPTTGK